MYNHSDDLIWKLIGEKEFCSFKCHTTNGIFCKNDLNITGFCSKRSCPLSNSQYSTVIEQEGVFFLIKKNENKLNFPNKIWTKIILSRNFLKAIQEIDLNLAFWPKFFLHNSKKRLTKLTQIFVRDRLEKIKQNKKFLLKKNINSKKEKRKLEILKKIKIDKIVEHELLNRLNLGIYGDLYQLLPIQKIKEKKSQNSSNLKEKKLLNYISNLNEKI